MFYIKSLADCEDVRWNNRRAFELYKLGEGAEPSQDAIQEADNESDNDSQEKAKVNRIQLEDHGGWFEDQSENQTDSL